MDGELNMLQCVKVHMMCTWVDTQSTLLWLSPWLAVKKQLGILFDTFHAYSVSPKREALVHSYNLNDNLQVYHNIPVLLYCTVNMKWKILNTCTADYGWQLAVRIRCTIHWQEVRNWHGDTINYHEVTRDGIIHQQYLCSLCHIRNDILSKQKDRCHCWPHAHGEITKVRPNKLRLK